MRRPTQSRTFYAVYRGWSPGVFKNLRDFEDQCARYPGHHFEQFKKEADAHRWLAYMANRGSKELITPCFLVHSRRDHDQKLSILTISHLPSGTVYDRVEYPRLNASHVLEYTTIVSLWRTLYETGQPEPIYTSNAKIFNWLHYKTHQTQFYLDKEPYPKALEQSLQDANAWLANQASHNPVMYWDEPTWGPMSMCDASAAGC